MRVTGSYVFNGAGIAWMTGFNMATVLFGGGREDGSLQAARGQARIPSAYANDLMQAAVGAGWGNRDGDAIAVAGERLKQAGCVVDLMSGFVGWPDKQTSLKENLSTEGFEDARLINEWTH